MKYLFLLLLVFKAHALELKSSVEQTHLLELYTSQSCSSCPPAERWMNDLEKRAGIWKSFIPISFHVTYWNHLSWKDKFSQDKFTLRQREYARANGTGLFTPQVTLDGQNFSSWSGFSDKNLSSQKVGILKVKIDNNKAQVHFHREQGKGDLLCYGAYMKSGFSTKIPAGENSGKILNEKFVALKLYQASASQIKNIYTCNFDLDLSQKQLHDKQTSLVFWMTQKSNLKVVQAVGSTL